MAVILNGAYIKFLVFLWDFMNVFGGFIFLTKYLLSRAAEPSCGMYPVVYVDVYWIVCYSLGLVLYFFSLPVSYKYNYIGLGSHLLSHTAVPFSPGHVLPLLSSVGVAFSRKDRVMSHSSYRNHQPVS